MLKAFVRLVCRLLFRVEVHGDPSVLDNPRTLVIANHESFLDGPLLALFLPLKSTFVVHSEVLRNPLFRWILGGVPHLAVDPTNPLALKAAIRLIETGKPAVIFPEGRITTTGSLMKVYDGAAFVAARTGATVVPVRLTGPAQSYFSRLAGLYPRKLFPKISITILGRHTIAMPATGKARERRRKAGQAMRQIMLEMLVATRPRGTLFEAFLDAGGTFGRNYRLVEDVRMVEESYGSLTKMALGIARLVSKFTVPGENVGLLLPNIAPTLGAILGLSAMRRVPAMLNYTAGPEGIRAACVAARIRHVITLRSFLEKGNLGHLVADLGEVRVHYLEDLKKELRLGDKLWLAVRLVFPRLAIVPQLPSDPAVVLFTSGSEGKPKGVVHSHESILANVTQVRAISDFNPNDKFMVALPLFHSFGLTCGALLPLVAGCRVFLYPSPLHYRIIPELVYDRNCTVLFGTSTFLGHYARFAHPYDFGRLRYVVAGAEKLSEDVRRTWIDTFGVRILEGYGVTECAPVIAVNTPMAARPGSVGPILPGIEYELEPVPGIERGGVLTLKGPNVMLGYLLYDRPGELQPPSALGRVGWYSTGDVVEIDEDGFLYIRGRVKRFAKVAGEMISLEVVERIAVAAAPGFVHAASTRPDPGKGEALVLFTTAPDLSREALLAAAKGQGLTELAVPRVIRRIDAIPLLGSGKTDYVALKRMAETEAA